MKGVHEMKSTTKASMSHMGDSDFYLCDVDEPAVGLGFMFSW
jgi:hypothetical protein